MRSGCSCAERGCGSKKTLLALERARSDIARRRRRWRSWQANLDPRRLVFIDETWIKTNMAPLRGWGPKGERVSEHAERAYSAGRCNHWTKVKNPQHPAYRRAQDQF